MLILGRTALLALALLVLRADNLRAQPSLGEQRRQASRTELEQSVKYLEEAAAATRDAKLKERYAFQAESIRQRLRNGDFAPGDRILLQVYGDSVLSDTFTVRGDRMLRLPSMPDIPLQGVLGSELEPFITKTLGTYVKDVRVDAAVLVRLGVMGAVGKPGFLTVPVDQSLTDVIMAAGGPAGQTADLDHATVRRSSKTIIDHSAFRDALRLGKTVGDVAMRDGDEILVPDKSKGLNGTTAFQALAAVASIFWAIRLAGGRRTP